MPRLRALTVLLFTGACVIAACASAACGDDYNDDPDVDATSTLRMIDVAYDEGVLRGEVAATADERSTGLGGREELGRDAGMLFDLGVERIPSFWMKDTRIPLDFVWIGADKRIIAVTPDVQPQPGVADGALRRYSPPAPVRYVLELNAGEAERRNLTPGDLLRFDL